jgi:hypothetical protein
MILLLIGLDTELAQLNPLLFLQSRHLFSIRCVAKNLVISPAIAIQNDLQCGRGIFATAAIPAGQCRCCVVFCLHSIADAVSSFACIQLPMLCRLLLAFCRCCVVFCLHCADVVSSFACIQLALSVFCLLSSLHLHLPLSKFLFFSWCLLSAGEIVLVVPAHAMFNNATAGDYSVIRSSEKFANFALS